jgi:SAM-dependent methyltransferase
VPSPPDPQPAEPCPACGEAGFRLLCSGTDRIFETTTKEFDIVECEACKLIRLSPWPDPAELRLYYPSDYWFVPEQTASSRLGEAYRRLVLRDHIAFVMKALERSTASGPVLDVGCGGGLFLRLLAERGRKVIGLDFSLPAAAAAWWHNGVPAVCASLSKAPLPYGVFSAVTMFHVLEHLYDPVAYLDAAYDLLEEDGRLIVQVPNASSWQFLLLGENWAGADIPRHLLNFRMKDLEILLDRCGFEPLRVKHFSLRDNPAALATGIAPWLDPMARRVRRVPESSGARLFKDLLYFALVLASLPFTVLEAACRAGSTVMIEARKRPGFIRT